MFSLRSFSFGTFEHLAVLKSLAQAWVRLALKSLALHVGTSSLPRGAGVAPPGGAAPGGLDLMVPQHRDARSGARLGPLEVSGAL